MKYVIIVIVLIVILLCLYLLIFRYFSISRHLTNFFSIFCPDQAIFDSNNFTWTQNFRNNWTTILDEFNIYCGNNLDKKNTSFDSPLLPYHQDLNTDVTWCDIDRKWKTLYLRIFNKDTIISNFFPNTMKLINSCPCTLAYFSILEPGAKLSPHYGIYKGVIRYHLGLMIPDNWQNCFIIINGIKLHWYPGKDIMFDDCYLHHVENNTNQYRLILFLDIKRDFKNPIINGINTLLLQFIKSNDSLNKTLKEINKHSMID